MLTDLKPIKRGQSKSKKSVKRKACSRSQRDKSEFSNTEALSSMLNSVNLNSKIKTITRPVYECNFEKENLNFTGSSRPQSVNIPYMRYSQNYGTASITLPKDARYQYLIIFQLKNIIKKQYIYIKSKNAQIVEYTHEINNNNEKRSAKYFLSKNCESFTYNLASKAKNNKIEYLYGNNELHLKNLQQLKHQYNELYKQHQQLTKQRDFYKYLYGYVCNIVSQDIDASYIKTHLQMLINEIK